MNGIREQKTLKLSPHDQNVVQYYLPKNEVAADLADLFSVFSDATRVKILSTLCITEMCVTDLCLMLCQNQSTISHQLAFLRSLRLVKARRKGKIVYYSIGNKKIINVFDAGIAFLGF